MYLSYNIDQIHQLLNLKSEFVYKKDRKKYFFKNLNILIPNALSALTIKSVT
jgi:hypothetical protein